MPSSSESRSRSARRSPDRRGGETSGRPEDVYRGRMPPPEPEGEPPKPATQTAPSASRARRAGGGAVRHRRQDGEAGTWTCPDCRRVISDCPTARDQHINGTYHRASLLWNEGFHKDFGQCQQEVLRRLDWEAQERKREKQLRLASRARSSSPQKRRKSVSRERKKDRSSRRRERRSDRESRRRNRSTGRRARKHRECEAADKENQLRERSESKRRHGQEREKPRQSQGRPRSSAATEPAYEVVRVTVKEEKRVTASGAKDQKEAEPESSEYTYEYESASPKMETDDAKKGKAAVGAQAQTAAVKKEQELKTAAKMAPVAKAGAAEMKTADAPASAGDQVGSGGAQDRRARMFNELLKTAMETAANLER